MISFSLIPLVLALIASSAVAAPSRLVERARPVLLADGSSFKSGSLGKTLKWQSGGVLYSDSCPGDVNISSCYSASLGANGNRAAPDRQRLELYSYPVATAGQTWTYNWSYYLVPGVSSYNSFFHLSQLLSRESGGYVIALDLLASRVKILDKTGAIPSVGSISSAPVASFWGKTTYHSVTVTYGAQGSLRYTIRGSSDITQTPLIDYILPNATVAAQTSIKTGLYRYYVQGQSPATAYLGDFSFVKSA
ncbi:hypothetical protein BCR35DRAFT_314621 [Leucosporidium creatinivorum]|uniref:Uncharacterized protein n=1 Tax=Leucosporidium creatinivorum TaxID=106004 RepID=A0A1Y2EVQ7_9BASI|nr:hypothetical protein BCR35DRAFT_314621 [Leucosporidium creatinivorum]